MFSSRLILNPQQRGGRAVNVMLLFSTGKSHETRKSSKIVSLKFNEHEKKKTLDFFSFF